MTYDNRPRIRAVGKARHSLEMRSVYVDVADKPPKVVDRAKAIHALNGVAFVVDLLHVRTERVHVRVRHVAVLKLKMISSIVLFF